MTPREFSLAVRGKKSAQEQQYRAGWEQARMVAYYSVVATNGSKHLRKPTQLMRFPWEDSELEAARKDYEASKGIFKEKLDG